MATSKKSRTGSAALIRALKTKNAALRTRLRKAQEASEAYRKAYQALAIKQITPEQLKEWDREEKDSGQTILDVLKEFQPGGRRNGRA